jgi:hypothetical protein
VSKQRRQCVQVIVSRLKRDAFRSTGSPATDGQSTALSQHVTKKEREQMPPARVAFQSDESVVLKGIGSSLCICSQLAHTNMAAFFGIQSELLRSLRTVQAYERDDVSRIDALMAIEAGQWYLHAHRVDTAELPFKAVFGAKPANSTHDLIKRAAAYFFPNRVAACLDSAVSMLHSKLRCALAIESANKRAPQHRDGMIPHIQSEAALYDLWRTTVKRELDNGHLTLPDTRRVILEAQMSNKVTTGAITPASVRNALRSLGFEREAVSGLYVWLPVTTSTHHPRLATSVRRTG